MATVKINDAGLLDYAKAGRDAVKEVKKVVRQVLNIGRKEARQRISSEFKRRTGYLRRQARRMNASVIVTQAEIKGRVSPIPRLMNIFEHGATLSNGRGTLRARPVVTPSGDAMERDAHKMFEQLLRGIGK
jgi:hypothetical protein